MIIMALDRAPANAKRTLYVCRPMTNADALIEWAKAQGFAKTLSADDLHVTVAFSRDKLDWFAAPDHFDNLIIPDASDQKDGTRSVEELGKQGAVVLRFESTDLADRWRQFRDAGASWDHDAYRPHITITYDAGDVDLSKVEPFAGPIELGPERFEEIKEDWTPKMSGDAALALDRSSARTYDKDGRLHVAVTNISKAAVNPYLGREIPDFEALGLSPDNTYRLYRDPEELAKGAATFNNLPLLSRHVPVTADNHQPDLVVGSTGSSAKFEAPFLSNSLVIWARDAINGVENERQKELSSAYRYRADMTPGKTPDGDEFDGVMRDIIGNHVALVKEGRAGPDVVVGDAKPSLNIGAFDMTKSAVLTRKAIFVQGALVAALAPRLAQDAKVDISPLFDGVTAKNLKDKTPAILAALKERTAGKLAQDATIDDLTDLLDVLEKAEVAEGADIDPNSGLPINSLESASDNSADQVKAFLAGKLSDDDLAKVLAMLGGGDKAMDEDDEPQGAEDEDEEEKKDVVTKTAMDAAITAAVDKARKDAAQTQREIRDAERAVRPYVGDLAMAHDSADGVYKTALTTLGVNVDNVHPSAFSAILAAQPKPGAKTVQPARVAMDSATSASFANMFPDAAKIGHA